MANIFRLETNGERSGDVVVVLSKVVLVYPICRDDQRQENMMFEVACEGPFIHRVSSYDSDKLRETRDSLLASIDAQRGPLYSPREQGAKMPV